MRRVRLPFSLCGKWKVQTTCHQQLWTWKSHQKKRQRFSLFVGATTEFMVELWRALQFKFEWFTHRQRNGWILEFRLGKLIRNMTFLMADNQSIICTFTYHNTCENYRLIILIMHTSAQNSHSLLIQHTLQCAFNLHKIFDKKKDFHRFEGLP